MHPRLSHKLLQNVKESKKGVQPHFHKVMLHDGFDFGMVAHLLDSVEVQDIRRRQSRRRLLLERFFQNTGERPTRHPLWRAGPRPHFRTCLGVPIRITWFWCLCWSPPIYGNYHIGCTDFGNYGILNQGVGNQKLKLFGQFHSHGFTAACGPMLMLQTPTHTIVPSNDLAFRV